MITERYRDWQRGVDNAKENDMFPQHRTPTPTRAAPSYYRPMSERQIDQDAQARLDSEPELAPDAVSTNLLNVNILPN